MRNQHRIQKAARNRTEHQNFRQSAQRSTYLSGSSQRLAKAWGILLIAFLAVCFIDGNTDTQRVARQQASSNAIEQISFTKVLEGASRSDKRASLSTDFEREVMSLVDFKDVQVAGDGKIISFYSSRPCDAVLKMCCERLADNGWSWVESGEDRFVSFLKTDGLYTWLYLSCTEVAGETSVVMQLG